MEAGKLKNVKRKGISFYGVKYPDSATDHAFRMAIMVWLLGKNKRINHEKAIKIALLHDLCKIYTGDITPYDGLLPKNKKDREEFVKKWRRLPLSEKKKRHDDKYKKEYAALKKILSTLPEDLRKEIESLWTEYHKGVSHEARFVAQVDVVENLIEALEGWKQDNKFPTRPWWEHADEAVFEPALLDLLKEIEREELK